MHSCQCLVSLTSLYTLNLLMHNIMHICYLSSMSANGIMPFAQCLRHSGSQHSNLYSCIYLFCSMIYRMIILGRFVAGIGFG